MIPGQVPVAQDKTKARGGDSQNHKNEELHQRLNKYDRRNLIVKRTLTVVLALPIVVLVTFFGLGMYSETGRAPGLKNGQLTPCSSKPNCVSSEASPSDTHSVAALEWDSSTANEPFMNVRKVLQSMGAEIIYSDESYLASTFTSGIFHFVDDVEFRIDQGSKLIHIRSASRVGYSDLGANRKRVEKISAALDSLRKNQ